MEGLDRSVQEALKTIFAQENFKSNTQIVVSDGSDSGDGYASKTLSVTLTENGKILNLFIKYFPIENVRQTELIFKIFNNERIFYTDIFPALLRFQSEKCIREPFHNVPKFFDVGTTSGVTPIVLENLKVISYDVRKRQNQIDEDHLNFVLETFGKLHATGFALKDQRYEVFSKITNSISDVLIEAMTASGFDKVLEACINQCFENMDPVADSDILKFSDGMSKYLVDFVKSSNQFHGDYCTILQGDCWSNNMMFLYNANRKPLDIKLIDWQIIKVNYPVFDLSYFFYSTATPNMLENWKDHLKKYYNYFSQHCRNLGSDPDVLYPFHKLEDQWIKYCKFGLAMAFIIVKVMLYECDEAPDLAKSLENDTIDANLFNKQTKHQSIYNQRMKDILRHFMQNRFI